MSQNYEKRLVVRTTLDPMHRSVDKMGRIIDCNDKYARMLGYIKDEIIGMSIFDHTPEESHDIIRNIFDSWKNSMPIHNHKFPLVTKSGNVFDVLITVGNIMGSDGEVIRSNTTLLDYEEVAQMQELVKLSKYESLYENSPEMYRTVNINGVIVDCNTSYADKLKYTKAEIIGRNLVEHTADKSISDMLIHMARWRVDGVCKPGEIWMKGKDGSEFPALVSPTNLYDEDGALLGRNVVIQDLTEMRETMDMLEQRQQIDKMKDEFLTGITHELKTPLTPIIGFSQALTKPRLLGALNERQQDAVNTILQNALHLRQLVTDLLDIHKVELGRMKFDFREVDVEAMMKDVYASVEGAAADKQIAVTMDIQEKGNIVVDKMRISEVCNNLLYNAIDFTPEKIGKIHITVEKGAEDRLIQFSVRDNGVGIPADKQSSLFEKFYQVSTSLTRRYGGTGLGLSICKGLVEGMGGTIWVESELGDGSTFYFTVNREGVKR